MRPAQVFNWEESWGMSPWARSYINRWAAKYSPPAQFFPFQNIFLLHAFPIPPAMAFGGLHATRGKSEYPEYKKNLAVQAAIDQ